jgi:hypothetical protein
MGQALGKAVAPLAKQAFVVELVNECALLPDQGEQLALWTRQLLQELSQ